MSEKIKMIMGKINYKLMLLEHPCKKGALALKIFPDLKHPGMALTAVLAGKRDLSVSESMTLMECLGITPEQFFSYKNMQPEKPESDEDLL